MTDSHSFVHGTTSPSYVIITPAYNEEMFVRKTIESVARQTFLPRQWLIVDDGSTDGTGQIIDRAASEFSFISRYYRERNSDEPYFASNVRAIMDGYRLLQKEKFDYLAILDADIVLPPNYYRIILERFSIDHNLGIASGVYKNLVDGKLQKVLHDRRSTPKAIQIFRKEVFDSIGGFLPLKYGGEDTISCVMARMNGWKAWSFPDITATHLRPTGTGVATSLVGARYRQGIAEYHIGSHPLFVLLKNIRRMLIERPFFFGGVARLAGYTRGLFSHEVVELPEKVKMMVREEQLERILTLNRSKLESKQH